MLVEKTVLRANTHTTGMRYPETVLAVLTSPKLYRGKENAGSNMFNNSCACVRGVRTSFDLCVDLRKERDMHFMTYFLT